MVSRDRLYIAMEMMFERLYHWARSNKLKMLLLILFEIWVHSLMFSHLGELKKITELIPFSTLIFGG